MRTLTYAILLFVLTTVSASAQAPLLVSHLGAEFQWDLQPFTAENAPESHVLTCGSSSVTVPMPATSIPVRDVVPGPGSYTCVLYAQNAAGRQADPDVPFPIFQSGYTPGVPFQLQVLADPGGPPDPPEPPIMATWYYPGGEPDTSFDDGTTNLFWQPHNYCYGSAITLPTGTVTQLGAFVDTNSTGAINLKLGIYDSGGTLVVQASAISIPNGSTKTWRTADVADTAITGGTFYVVGVSSTTELRWGYDSSGDGMSVNQNYASSMGSSVTIDGPETGTRFGVRAEVEEGGAASRQGLMLMGMGR